MGGHRCMAVKAMVIDSPVVLQLYAYIYIYIFPFAVALKYC